MKKNIFIQLLILIAIVVVVNLIANKLYFRLDFTSDQRYTLSNATENILENLDDVVSIKAYFSEDLPPQLLSNRQDFQDLLIEFENRSSGSVVYQFVNPSENEVTESEAQGQGIQPIVINVTDRDQIQQMRAYMGAVIQMADRTEVIPVIQPGAAMEYDLTTAIKKISIVDKPKIGFIQGHGEPGIEACAQLSQQLNVLYTVEPYTISEEQIPATYKALAIIDPQDTIPPDHFNKIQQYMQLGGSVFVSFSPVIGDLQTQTPMLRKAPEVGLKPWLSSNGVTVGDSFVVDAQCGRISVRQRFGAFGYVNSQVQFPYFPVVTNFGEHSISSGLESLRMPFVTNLTINNSDSSRRVIPLAMTSENTGLVPSGRMIDVEKKWEQSDFPLSSEILAAAIENPSGSRLVIIPNGQFVVNGAPGQNQQQLNPDNINFASNAIDWLSDDTGLIDLRTKGVTSRPLPQLEDATRNTLKYGNVFAPILLILIYAFVRKQANSRRRSKWMQGEY
ncbi:MAG: GldG family protein [Cyclobacteriaceae bacterium]